MMYNEAGVSQDAMQSDPAQDDSLVQAAIAALNQSSDMRPEDREAILIEFESTYGPGSIQELMEELESQSGGVNDGMSDSIPATIEGETPARLSRGEYVVPADVVSFIGNGSSEAGAEQLEHMIAKIRSAKTGSEEQPPAIDAAGIMGVR
jgi:hypothetical protein